MGINTKPSALLPAESTALSVMYILFAGRWPLDLSPRAPARPPTRRPSDHPGSKLPLLPHATTGQRISVSFGSFLPFLVVGLYALETAHNHMPHIRLLSLIGDRLSSVQSILAFERWKGFPQFESDKGFGRVALLACVLGSILGVHVVLCLQLALVHLRLLPKLIFGDWSDETLQMAMQWTVYVIALCAFHLAEFFTTAIFNPSATSADSFMVCTAFCRDNLYFSICVIIIQRHLRYFFAGKSFQSIHCCSFGE